MELRVLRYFLAVAQEENITKAAALLHLTQPTLSRQLMQLEEELGTKLFRRSQYRIILTEDGMLLRRRAQELVELADKTQREFSRRDAELSGEIAIGCGETRSMTFLSQRICSFRGCILGCSFEFTAPRRTTSRSGSRTDCWIWACWQSRWTSAGTPSSGCPRRIGGACWC